MMMPRCARFLLALLFWMLPSHAFAETLTAEWFATAAAPAGFSLAPDGLHLAHIVSHDGKGKLRVMAIETLSRKEGAPTVTLDADDGNIVRFRWLTGTRLLLTVQQAGQIVTQLSGARGNRPSTRQEKPRYLVAVDIDGSNRRRLRPNDHDGNGLSPIRDDVVISIMAGDTDHILMLAQEHRYANPSVVRVNTHTGAATEVMGRKPRVLGWIADRTGKLRVALRGRDRGFAILALRDDGRLVELANPHIVEMSAQGMGLTPDTLLVKARDKLGVQGLYELPLTPGAPLRPLVTDSKVDIRRILYNRIGINGVEMASDHPTFIMIDPRLKAIQQQLQPRWPDTGIEVMDVADDGLTVLANFHQPALPPVPVLINMEDGAARTLVADIPADQRPRLGTRESVTIRARDGMEMTAILSLPTPRPTHPTPFIILPHARMDSHADTGFHWLAQFLVSRGYGVLQPNSRGSTGRGLPFEQAGNGQWGRAIQDDLVDATRWAIDQGIADPTRLCMVGMGFGGYSAMVAAFRDPQLYRCTVSINGHPDLGSMYDEAGLYWTGGVTRDRIGQNRDALAAVSPLRQVDRMVSPLLMIQGGADQEVPQEDSRSFMRAMVNAGKEMMYVGLPQADHSLTRPQDRTAVLNRLEAFLAAMVPPPAPPARDR